MTRHCPEPMPPHMWCFTHCIGWYGDTPEGRPLAKMARMYARVTHWPECINPSLTEKAARFKNPCPSGCRPITGTLNAAIHEIREVEA